MPAQKLLETELDKQDIQERHTRPVAAEAVEELRTCLNLSYQIAPSKLRKARHEANPACMASKLTLGYLAQLHLTGGHSYKNIIEQDNAVFGVRRT